MTPIEIILIGIGMVVILLFCVFMHGIGKGNIEINEEDDYYDLDTR